MKPIISIVVPVYNVAPYLERCVNTLTNQTLKRIEIILVNDGSSDNSLEICEKLKQDDARIKVINQDNLGVSVARNVGIKQAVGEYVGFIDPDDWIDLNMYEKMYEASIFNQSDVVLCDYFIETESSQLYISTGIKKKNLDFDLMLAELIPFMLAPEKLEGDSRSIMGSVCRLLIKRELIYRENIYFNEELPLMEDLVFCLRVFLDSNRITILNQAYYHYFQRKNSAVSKYRREFYKENMTVLKVIKKIFEDKEIYSELVKKQLNYREILVVLNSIYNCMNSQNQSGAVSKYKDIKEIIITSNISSYLNELDFEEYSLKRKLILKSLTSENAMKIFIYHYSLSLSRKIVNNFRELFGGTKNQSIF